MRNKINEFVFWFLLIDFYISALICIVFTNPVIDKRLWQGTGCYGICVVLLAVWYQMKWIKNRKEINNEK